MNRRRYLQLMGFAGVAPALPAVAAAAPVAPAATPSAVQYAWAAHYAKVHNTASPARLAAALKVSPEVAQGLIQKLTANGVITTQAAGVSTAVAPFRKAQFLRPSGADLIKRVMTQVRTLAAQSAVPDGSDAFDDAPQSDARPIVASPPDELSVGP